MTTNILILAAGQSSVDEGDNPYPLCLTEYDGDSVLEKIVKASRGIVDGDFTFALLENEINKFHLESVVRILVPNCKIVKIKKGTKGSGCTALLASSKMHKDDELLIVSANEIVDLNYHEVIYKFKEANIKAGTVIFHSIHPRYSYVSLGDDGLVVEAAQKKPISVNATTGLFWFERVGDFIDAVQSSIRKCASVDGNFYVAPVFNEMILKHQPVGVYRIANEKYKPLKTERQIVNYERGAMQ